MYASQHYPERKKDLVAVQFAGWFGRLINDEILAQRQRRELDVPDDDGAKQVMRKHSTDKFTLRV